MHLRRIATIGTLTAITLVAVATAPVLLLAALLLSLLPALRTLPHTVCFALGFLALEWSGLAQLFWVWLRHRHSGSYMDRNRDVQMWWARRLLRLGQRLFRLNVSVSGEDALVGPTAIVLSRHTSLADTILPILFFADARNEGMRYILKKELQLVPCLDIGGNRLPNHFVDRSGIDTQRELDAVQMLAASADSTESVLVYPEGTRYSPAKHASLRARRPELADQLDRWPDLLPPRIGGVDALLRGNPGKDVVCLAHVGLEGAGSIRDLIDGRWLGQTIKLHFWRIPNAEIPQDHTAFLFSLWDEMQFHVARG